jgi:hypothetical protein
MQHNKPLILYKLLLVTVLLYSREKHFSLRNNVEVYGGYSDASTTKTETTLQGQLGGARMYHLFYHPGNTSTAAKIDNTAKTSGIAMYSR